MSTSNSILRYLRPAETWTEALPVGNGHLGGMVFASPMEDVIALNEETLWGVSDGSPDNPLAHASLDKVRQLVFAGKLTEAEHLIDTDMLADPRHFPPYEPLGNLRVLPIKPINYSDYSRELDLETATASCAFTLDGSSHQREYFVSADADVIATRHWTANAFPRMKITLDRDESVRLRGAGTPRPLPGQAADMIGLIDVSAQGDPRERILLMQGTVDGGIDFVAGAIVKSDGDGLLLSHHWDDRGPSKIFASGGSELIVMATAQSTFNGQSLQAATERVIDTLIAADAKGYERIQAEHVATSRSYFERFSLRLRPKDQEVLAPTVVPELLGNARNDQADWQLMSELFVNYCRYLLASSSRPGGLPSNLQGIWNAERWPTWESDFHPNINLQLNYWPADPLGLPEAVEPLADWLLSTRRSGEITARETYNSRGWTMNHISNAWGFTAPGAGVFGIWPFGGAWLALNLYDHYLFTMDIEFLRHRVYPMLKGSAEFFLDFLVEGAQGTAAEGHLVTVPSNSPENSFYDENGNEAVITYGSTMDTMEK